MKNLFNSKCSVFTHTDLNNDVFFARNFDFNRISNDTRVIYVPRNTTFYTNGNDYENNLDLNTKIVSKYATLGIGTTVLKPNITYYDGINEEGLAVAQLYFRGLASFSSFNDSKLNVQPTYLVTYLLATCKDVLECKEQLENYISLYSFPLLGEVAPLHFIVTDKFGNSLVIEQEKDGLHLYDQNLGILTNSPSYSYHLTNLTNYFNLNNLDIEEKEFSNLKLDQMYSGQGLHGLPGDFSSPSRFVRLAFFKEYLTKMDDYNKSLAQVFKAIQNVSFPLGLCKALGNGNGNEFDKVVVDYDYTIYTSCYSLTKLEIYVSTYFNLEIKKLSLLDLMKSDQILEFEFLNKTPEYKSL